MNVDQPLISIVIANYNYGRFIETAILSVLNQCVASSGQPLKLPSGEAIELIVVDGGSSDNSVDVIRKYEDKLTWWCSEKDRGQSHAFNKGFSHASGKYLTWLNADDVVMPGGLAAIARKMNAHPSCQWFVGSTVWMDESLRIIRCFRAHRFSVLRARWGTLSAGGPSSFFGRLLFERLGPIDETLHFLMDIDLWHRLYFQGRAKYIRVAEYVWGYRIHKNSKMSGSDVAPGLDVNKRNREASEKEAQYICKKYEKRRSFERIANIFSFSLLDGALAAFENFTNKGKRVL
jgi:glycosyltransferase involved in cell wall biosynthesis